MTLHPAPNTLHERVLVGTASSGLRLVVDSKPGFARTFAALGVDFGSIDRRGGPDGQPVPAGLAHFLEHELFEDEHGDVSDRFARHGAWCNASTGYSTTSYVFSTSGPAGPSLELLLDFVQTPWFTDELVARERSIIGQEIRMYDDDPDWVVFQNLMECLYERHPARDNIAGTLDSIAGIDAATLRRCYGLFYHPRNMCLVVAGGMDPDEVVERVERDQRARGVDPRAAHARDDHGEPARVRAARHEATMPISRPRLVLGIKETRLDGGPLAVRRRELTTRLLLDALFGRASRTFERLYEDGLVDETFTVSHVAEDGFGLTIVGGDTDDPEGLEARVRAAFEDARRDGLDEAALRRTRNKVRGAMLRGLDSPESAAYALLVETFRGVPPLGIPEAIEGITLDELRARLDEHVRDEAIAVAVLRPS